MKFSGIFSSIFSLSRSLILGVSLAASFVSSQTAAQSEYDGFSFTEPNSFPSTIGGEPLAIPCGHAQQAGLFDNTSATDLSEGGSPMRGLANDASNPEKTPVTQPPEDDPLAFDPCR